MIKWSERLDTCHCRQSTFWKNTSVLCFGNRRTHQIRVHLAHIGHPIVGDPLYQNRPAERLMLHALELHMIHPFTQEK